MLEMREMSQVLKRLVWSSLAAVLVIALSVVGWFILQERAQQDFLRRREIARLGRTAAALATDRETGIRGYLLTHDQRSLVPEVIGRTQLPRKLDSLALMTSHDSIYTARIRSLTHKLDRWEAGFADPALRGEVTPEATLAGKPLFDEVRI
jgi:CHASE3 domain sensor protein